MDTYLLIVLAAAILAGAAVSLLGVYIVGMRMPFIGICISHAAMAGAVASVLLSIDPVYGSLCLSMLAAVAIVFIRPTYNLIDNNLATAIIFSLMLGMVFLLAGFIEGSRTEILSLMWGNLLFVRNWTMLFIGAVAVVLAVFLAVFNRQLKAILFSRTIAAATGVPEKQIMCAFLLICGFVIAVNLQIVGGLMIFSLINNPAAAAYQVCRGFKAVVIASVAFGVISAVGGFAASWWFDLPTGACIVLASTAIFIVASIVKKTARLSA